MIGAIGRALGRLGARLVRLTVLAALAVAILIVLDRVLLEDVPDDS